MKPIFYLLTLALGFLFSANGYAQNFQIDSSEDEEKTKKAVLHWADSVFLMHKEWKFENFRPFYTEEYEIAYLRSNAYKERLEDLEKEKESGRYKKSEEDYKKEHQEMRDTYLKIKSELDGMTKRADYFQINFWSNIQTNDGITVYYEHIVKVDNNYNVIEATINSAIGKKSDKTEIIYKKDVNGKKKLGDPKKVEPQQTNRINEPPKDGSVQLIVPEEQNTNIKEEGDKKKKKKKKDR